MTVASPKYAERTLIGALRVSSTTAKSCPDIAPCDGSYTATSTTSTGANPLDVSYPIVLPTMLLASGMSSAYIGTVKNLDRGWFFVRSFT